MSEESVVVAVISPERQIREQIAFAFEGNPQVEAVWTLGEYPSPAQLAQIHAATGGCVVFLDFSDPVRARTLAAELDQGYPMAVTIAVHLSNRQQDIIELMQLGVREVISLPFSEQEANRAFQRATLKLKGNLKQSDQGGRMFAFLPARPGSGATTIAAHAAAAAARLSGNRTLLIDFDLRLGMTSFLFKLHSDQSVLDALCLSERLDETLWEQLVSRRGNLAILGSAPIEFGRTVPLGGAEALLAFARKHCETVCVDLPGEMREHELETLRRAQEIFLVCTPEVGTLHMAKRKADQLQTLEVHNRVSVILNRAPERSTSITTRDVEQILQLPVRFTVSSAEKEILEATQRAVAIEGRSRIAAQIEAIARRMIGGDPTATPEKKPRRFIEFFSVTPVRDKVSWR